MMMTITMFSGLTISILIFSQRDALWSRTPDLKKYYFNSIFTAADDVVTSSLSYGISLPLTKSADWLVIFSDLTVLTR